MNDICLHIQNYTCQSCGFRWTSSALVLRSSINGYREVDYPPHYRAAIERGAKVTCYNICNLQAPICHRCIDPTQLVEGWPSYEETPKPESASLEALLGPLEPKGTPQEN